MQKILKNLALISTLNYCQEKGIDCSGSAIQKVDKEYTYFLYNLSTGKNIVSVTFKENSVPLFINW